MPRKPARRVLELITTVPWAITAEALQTIIAVASREGLDPETIATKIYGRVPEPEALAAKPGNLLPGSSGVTLRNGVATVPVIGPMFRYADFFTQMSGGTTYDTLAMDFTAALESPEVNAILLDVDSPGGEANGVGELARLIYDARGKKPIVAYVGGMGASAAYWLAAAASEVVVHNTGIVGSIGVRMELMETWMRDASKGLRTISMVSTQSPRKSLAPSDIQAVIDQLATQFVSEVAQYRGASVDAVLADFGQGGVFVGQEAVAAGLADRLGTYESVHEELAGEHARRSESQLPFHRFTAGQPTMEALMKTTPDAPSAGAPAAPATTAKVETLTAAQVAEQHSEAAAALRAEGATAERTRILAIEELGIPGAEAVIAAAKADPACTPEATALKLVQAQRAGTVTAPATAAEDPGKKHLAALAGDEAKIVAPKDQPSGSDRGEVASTVQSLVQFSSLRRASAAAN